MSAYDTAKNAILGQPVDPAKKPSRTGVLQAFAEMQTQMEAAQSGAIIKDTKANLDALTSVPYVDMMAWVTNDPTPANNGIYEMTGTVGSPAWTRRTDIPHYVITGLNMGAGTANAIRVTSDLPLPSMDGRVLLVVPILAANTAASPTVRWNNGADLPMVTNSGVNLPAEALQPGMYVAGFMSGGKFRLLTEITSASILAQAEAYMEAAEIARDEAVAAAAGIQGEQQSRAWAIANYHPVIAPAFLRTAGYANPSDGGGALYKAVMAEPLHIGKLSITLDDGVTVKWFEIAEKVIKPKMIGAAANAGAGNTNDYAILNGMFAIGAPIYDGDGLDYYAIAADTASIPGDYFSVMTIPTGVTLRNLNLHMQDSPDWSVALVARGTEGTVIDISSNMAKFTFSVTAASVAGLAVNDWVRIRTNELWGNESGAAEQRGEIKQIRTINGGTNAVSFTDYSYDFYTDSGFDPEIVKINMLNDIAIENCKFYGGGDNSNHAVCWFEYINNLKIRDCYSADFDIWHWDIRGCINGKFVGNICERAHRDQTLGLNYGIVLSYASMNWQINDNIFTFFRHGVTIGGNYGVSRHITISNNIFKGQIDAGIDTHPGADNITITGNIICVNGNDSEYGRDGMMLQGANHVVTGNTIEGFTTAGIALQVMTKAQQDQHTVSNNIVLSVETNTIGIYIENYKQTWYTDQIAINNNNVMVESTGSRGVLVQSGHGSGSLDQVSFSGNNISAAFHGIIVSTSVGSIVDTSISGGNIKSLDTTNAYGVRGTGSGIGGIAMSGGTIRGGWANFRWGNSGYTVTTNDTRMVGAGAGGQIAAP